MISGMGNVMRNFNKLLCASFFLGFVVTAYGSRKLAIANDSSWKIELSYERGGKKLSRVLEPEGHTITLGDLVGVTNVCFQTYGKVYGAVAVPDCIDLHTIKAKLGEGVEDVVVHITAGWVGWSFTHELVNIAKQAQLPVTGNPYDAFPGAVRARQLGRKVEPRHILGVTESATVEDVNAVFKALSLKWHPDKHKNNLELVTKIQQILAEARNTLREELEGSRELSIPE